MLLVLVSTKPYVLCIVEINHFTAEKAGSSSYKAHTLLLAISLPIPQLSEGFRYKISMPTQLSNLTAVSTVSQESVMWVEATLWGGAMEFLVLFPVNCYRMAAEPFLTQTAALLMYNKWGGNCGLHLIFAESVLSALQFYVLVSIYSVLLLIGTYPKKVTVWYLESSSYKILTPWSVTWFTLSLEWRQIKESLNQYRLQVFITHKLMNDWSSMHFPLIF